MREVDKVNITEAKNLMDDYARRTGLTGSDGDITRRYLWTDAFAVQTLFGLAHALGEGKYKGLAINLIDVVHEVLGKFHPDDKRRGWISGLPEDEGHKRPTAGGLRIGKKKPERDIHEPFNERLEWERDGQYFHYLTRWIHALLQAEQETDDYRYGLWAADLLKAGGKFIYNNGGWTRMYWKMSTDLNRPLVQAMGAHDPLEGLICAESIVDVVPEKAMELEPLIHTFENLCKDYDWSTSDPLGIGGLLLNTVRAAELNLAKIPLPEDTSPEKLFEDTLEGLKRYYRMYSPDTSALGRLPFRELGLSLGLRAVQAFKDRSADTGLRLDAVEAYSAVADDIEKFWLNPANRNASTWTNHLDINAVSLAASLVAGQHPFAFAAVRVPK